MAALERGARLLPPPLRPAISPLRPPIYGTGWVHGKEVADHDGRGLATAAALPRVNPISAKRAHVHTFGWPSGQNRPRAEGTLTASRERFKRAATDFGQTGSSRRRAAHVGSA